MRRQQVCLNEYLHSSIDLTAVVVVVDWMALVSHPRLVLMIDALDELSAHEREKPAFKEMLDGLCRTATSGEGSLKRVVIASRYGALRERLSKDDTVACVAPLPDDVERDYVAGLLKAWRANDHIDKNIDIEQRAAHVVSIGRTFGACQSPLLLLMLAMLDQSRPGGVSIDCVVWLVCSTCHAHLSPLFFSLQTICHCMDCTMNC
jgi:hypothetical protein